MVKNDTISAMKANRLYWLGRYEERVYMTLHLLRQCYDKMIDGDATDYESFWQRLDSTSSYATPEEFRFGMMYDEKNPCSITAELECAKDNAILLREDIMTETLSYIEMSIAHLNACKNVKETNITQLQPITDWSLAFWGSIFQRIPNPRITSLLAIGRTVEYIDMLIRYDYPFERIQIAWEDMKKQGMSVKRAFDAIIEKQLNDLLTKFQYEHQDAEYKDKVLKYINHLVLV